MLSRLGSALQSGDLNGAQQAYNALAALGQSGPFASSEPFSKSSRAQAFEAVGQALQSGDLAGAQAAFATLTGKNSSAGTSQAASSAVVNLSRAQPPSGQPISATTAPSASSIYQQLQSYRQERNADLAQLGTDLASRQPKRSAAGLQHPDRISARAAPIRMGKHFSKPVAPRISSPSVKLSKTAIWLELSRPSQPLRELSASKASRLSRPSQPTVPIPVVRRSSSTWEAHPARALRVGRAGQARRKLS